MKKQTALALNCHFNFDGVSSIDEVWRTRTQIPVHQPIRTNQNFRKCRLNLPVLCVDLMLLRGSRSDWISNRFYLGHCFLSQFFTSNNFKYNVMKSVKCKQNNNKSNLVLIVSAYLLCGFCNYLTKTVIFLLFG